jgi:hypothetical protein
VAISISRASAFKVADVATYFKRSIPRLVADASPFQRTGGGVIIRMQQTTVAVQKVQGTPADKAYVH